MIDSDSIVFSLSDVHGIIRVVGCYTAGNVLVVLLVFV
jgi:hypothetical protein